MDLSLLKSHWGRLPHLLRENIAANTRASLSDETRERNRCYMVGMVAAYCDTRTLDEEQAAYVRALIHAPHANAAIRDAYNGRL